MLSKTEELLIALGEFCKDVYSAGLHRNLNQEYYNHKKIEYDNIKDKKKFYARLYKLRKNGYTTSNGITAKGVVKIIRAKNKLKERSNVWDGKWRIVIFDIPETKKNSRDYFRRTLEDLNFMKLQNSVWVSPYDICDDLRMIVSNLEIRNNVLLVLSVFVENEDYIIKKFFKNYKIKLVKKI